MNHQSFLQPSRRFSLPLLLFSIFVLILSACGSGNPGAGTSSTPAARQVLTFPNVGTPDISVLDPALGADSNSALAVGMLYSGLARFDKNLHVVPDQATWTISPDRKVYTFTLKPGLTFSDGTPVTAQTYVYTLTRALLPALSSRGSANLFLGNIAGASDVSNGKSTVLTGVKALNDSTLQITLTQPTEYFLQVIASSISFALNQKIIEQYGQTDWINHAAGGALGTGPFMVKEWKHNTSMVFVPNPHYYGAKPRLSEVDMFFVNDLHTAFQSYRAHQYDFDWNIVASDLKIARTQAGYTNRSLLETDMLFFDNTKPPFNQSAVRQAFAYAINKNILATSVFDKSVVAAPTIIPPGMPGYQPGYQGLTFDTIKAKMRLQSAYPDVSKVPSITFSYPNSQVSPQLAQALQQMWQTALGIQVKLNPMELSAYNSATNAHQIQFGFTQWGADFPDPYDWLALNLLSTASNNNGLWNNPQFDATIAQAEVTSGPARIALYNKAEQIAVSDVGWLPIDHQTMSALIPTYVHGVSLNNTGLYFGDWSNVYLLQH